MSNENLPHARSRILGAVKEPIVIDSGAHAFQGSNRPLLSRSAILSPGTDDAEHGDKGEKCAQSELDRT